MEEQKKSAPGPSQSTQKLSDHKGLHVYRHFFDHSEIPFCIIGLDGSFHLVNAALSKMLGYSQDEILMKKFTDLVHHDDQPAAIAEFRLIISQKMNYYEKNFICGNGSLKLLACNFITEVPKGLIYASARDITEQREIEKALIDAIHEKKKTFRDMSNEFKVLLDAIPDNIMLLTPEMQIIWANKATGEKFSKNVKDLKGQFCYKLCCDIHSPCEHCPSLKSYMSGDDEEAIVRTADGKVWDIKSFPVKTEAGEVTNIIEVAKDITVKVSLESELDKTAQYLMTGEFDKLVKQVDQSDLISSIKNVLKICDLPMGHPPAGYGINGEGLKMPHAFSPIMTQNKKMLSIFHYVEAIAPTEKPVPITGETGVGKELIARSIHDVSGLKGKFAAINVAGLDDTMFSDTLFGHTKGAFTGADRERKGLILQATGGTLLLDEFGDLNEPSQIKLLRLLEDNSYYPLGSDNPEKADVRIIVTTNRDLKKLIREKKFREDLYYRLSSYFIHIPPLRERLEDIPLLLDHFLSEAAAYFKKKKPTYPRELVTLLANYEFPGNVRELKAMVYDALALHKSGILSMNIFKAFIHQKGLMPLNNSLSFRDEENIAFPFGKRMPTLKEAETYLISEAMKKAKGNQGIAASLLGITRHALNKKLKKSKPIDC